MKSIVFQKAGLSDLTLERGRLYPIAEPIEINQELYLTDGMNTKVINYGGTATYFNLVFRHLSKDNYDGTVNGLKTWFSSSTINYCVASFTLIDEKGVSHTVRLWQKKFDMRKEQGGRYSLSITLIEE